MSVELTQFPFSYENGTKILLSVSGRSPGALLGNFVFAYNIALDFWIELSPVPFQFLKAQGVSFGRRFMVLSGIATGGCWELNLAAETWTEFPSCWGLTSGPSFVYNV